MIETDAQRRWWFATHPEYSWSHGGTGRSKKEENENEIDPKDVDDYVDHALKHETDESVAALLKSVKRNFGTEADPTSVANSATTAADQWSQLPKEPQAIIRAPDPPGLSDYARSILSIVFPGFTKAYDRWWSGYYKAYPWAPGPFYDALGDLLGLVAGGIGAIQRALAKAVKPAHIAALQNAFREVLKIWEYGNSVRGWAIEDLLGRNLPRTFKGIDRWKDGVATSIKSMHLWAKSYQDPAKVLSQGKKYVDQLVNFRGASMGEIDIVVDHTTPRVLRLAVPPGATEAQKSALRRVIGYGKENGVRVEVIRVP